LSSWFAYDIVGLERSLTCRLQATPKLFTTPPNRRRILELVVQYDQLSDTVPLPDLRHESIHDVANLLGFWTTALPAPLMHRNFRDAFSAWCVEPSLTREKEHKHKVHAKLRKGEGGEYQDETDTEGEAESEEDEECPGLPSLNSRRKRLGRKQRAFEREKRRAFAAAHPELVISNRPSIQQRRTQMYRELLQLDTPQVNHARLLCMLIAPHCFAVLVYLFTFLASLADYPDNKVDVKFLAEKFGWKLFGGSNKHLARELMEWLLTR